jgi:dCTP deaminase
MQLLTRDRLLESIYSTEGESIFIDPLLDDDQIGEVSVDIRLGYDFLVSVFTRKPYVDISNTGDSKKQGIPNYFQETRRDIGDKFVLYPGQVVLATSLEYVALPSNTYLDLLTRSSYNRLGIRLNTMVQPGFRGCLPVELYNHSNSAIELIIGSRIFQARFFEINASLKYTREARKYYGEIRPKASQVNKDKDLKILNIIKQKSNT